MNQENKFAEFGWVLGALGAGAAAMYFLDPDRGHRRRTLLKDRATHLGRQTARLAQQGAYDTGQRVKGFLAERHADLLPSDVNDSVLEARVRSRLGHVVSHPHAMDVVVDQGCVTLFGPVLEDEHNAIVETVLAVRGLKELRDRLTTHRYAGAISGLQGGREKPTAMLEPMPPRYSPMGRLLVGSVGAAMSLYGLKRKGLTGTVAGFAGASLMTSAITNRGLRESLGIRHQDMGYVVERSVRIHAPLADIFRFWADPTNYPKLFPHIKKIERVEENMYRWTVAGPGNSTLSWDGHLVDVQPNKLIAWTTTPDSQVRNSGVLRFEPVYDGSTSLHVKLIYRPPSSLLGAFIADMSSASPKRTLSEDLLRCKNHFEGRTGKRSRIEAIDQLSSTVSASAAADGECMAGT